MKFIVSLFRRRLDDTTVKMLCSKVRSWATKDRTRRLDANPTFNSVLKNDDRVSALLLKVHFKYDNKKSTVLLKAIKKMC